MTNNSFGTFALAAALGSMIVICTTSAAKAQDAPLAEPQQRQLAKDILSVDNELRQTSVLIAQGLGVSRMSEDVRAALTELLAQLNSAQQTAAQNRIALETVVNGEFYLSLAETVAALKDPRSIPSLVQVGNYGFSRAAARGLASFGEQALPSILEVLDDPKSSGDLVAYNVMALSTMVQHPDTVLELSPTARSEIARIARNSLGSKHGTTLLMATELSVALDQPDLTLMVRAIAQDSRVLSARGVGPEMADLVRKHAADTLAKAPAGRSTP